MEGSVATNDAGGGFLHWVIEVGERHAQRPVMRGAIVLWRVLFMDIAPNLPASQIFALTSRGKFQIGVAASLVAWVMCLLVPGAWSILIGTHWGSEPGRIYFFRDWHNLFLYTLVCPGYVAAGSILIATVVSGLWGIREIEERICCRPVEIDRVSWRLPLLILFLLGVSMLLTSNYMNDVSDIERIRRVYWFLDRMAGGEVRLNSLGVYYFLLNFVLLLFTLIAFTFFMSAFAGTIRLASTISQAEPGSIKGLRFEELSTRLQTYIQAYLAAKCQVAIYIVNFWVWEKSPLGQTGNLLIAHVCLFMFGVLFLSYPRVYFELQWAKLKNKSQDIDLNDMQFDRLMSQRTRIASGIIDFVFIGTVMSIPILHDFMSYSSR
jgi:hypothetical protein